MTADYSIEIHPEHLSDGSTVYNLHLWHKGTEMMFYPVGLNQAERMAVELSRLIEGMTNANVELQ